MSLRILLVDDDPERAAQVEQGLAAAGYRLLARLSSGTDLRTRVEELGPDVVIIDMELPDRDTLEHMQALREDHPRPVVMFAEEGGGDTIRSAIQAGVSAYVVDGLRPERIQPVIEVAIERFREHQALSAELEATRNKLAGRKEVDRAKGLLMDKRALSEEMAYKTLRKMAMDRGRPLEEVARDLLAMADLLD
ncbi:ANTAR domain-containing response regulator [Thiohalorhabdus sp. Cl-TMA]|uniref:ANTAR domain-containing response regulator n=1 Tax=Thiohalorhabdus methylotrophus TaxID=3242694 RepID=A0ABV4TX16_9GAMM